MTKALFAKLFLNDFDLQSKIVEIIIFERIDSIIKNIILFFAISNDIPMDAYFKYRYAKIIISSIIDIQIVLKVFILFKKFHFLFTKQLTPNPAKIAKAKTKINLKRPMIEILKIGRYATNLKIGKEIKTRKQDNPIVEKNNILCLFFLF